MVEPRVRGSWARVSGSASSRTSLRVGMKRDRKHRNDNMRHSDNPTSPSSVGALELE